MLGGVTIYNAVILQPLTALYTTQPRRNASGVLAKSDTAMLMLMTGFCGDKVCHPQARSAHSGTPAQASCETLSTDAEGEQNCYLLRAWDKLG